MPKPTYRILAVLTRVRRIWVVQVAPIVVNEVSGPLQTGLPRWGIEDGELLRGTPDIKTMKLDGEHRAEQARIWVELIKPRAPEALHRRIGDLDTAEDTEHDHDEWVEQRSNLEKTGKSCQRLQGLLHIPACLARWRR